MRRDQLLLIVVGLCAVLSAAHFMREVIRPSFLASADGCPAPEIMINECTYGGHQTFCCLADECVYHCSGPDSTEACLSVKGRLDCRKSFNISKVRPANLSLES